MDWFTFTLIGFCAGLAGLVLFFAMSRAYWRERAFVVAFEYEEVMQRALDSEKDQAQTHNQLVGLQGAVYAMSNRPVIAVLSEEQHQTLIQAVQLFVSSNMRGDN